MNASSGNGRNRRGRNTFTTKSGTEIKVNRTMADRLKARKAAAQAAKALYLSTLPKGKIQRLLYRLHPQRVARYWFSRQGGIMALKIIGIAVVVGFFLTIGLFAYFRKDLPKIKDVAGTSFGGSITYYDRTGQTVLWQDYDAVKRIPVSENNISKYMKQATIAIEDKDFYKHGAFDMRGIMRAAVHDVSGGGGSVQGGSTITQQLVKLNENWTDNRTVTRKVKELILAVELEREYSKNEILTGYLNIAPYGGVEYGVESAARDYFQTSAKDLTLAQASMLAAIPQSPAYYSPYASNKYNPAVSTDTFSAKALFNRQHYILDQMALQGYITQKEADDAKKVDILSQIHQQAPKYAGIKAPYFVLSAKQELERTYGAQTVQRGGWKVTTTLDVNLQNKAEELIQKNIPNINRAGADTEALVAEDVQTGQIVSLVGGTDFTNKAFGQNNFASGIKIPPGSSFKPYDYATFINNNNNVGAGSVLYDSETVLPGYPCTQKRVNKTNPGNCLVDYDFKYPGPMTLRYALGGSRNVPAVKAMLSAVPNDSSSGKVSSINKTINTASEMMANKFDQAKRKSSYNCYGDEALTQTTQCYGASAIGDGAYLHLDDHVNGLSTLSRLGNAIPRTYILKISDAANKSIYEWKQPQAKQVIKADAAYIVNDMASDPKASYLPGSCSETNCTSLGAGGYKFHRYNGWKFAIKTGTTNDNFDGLMTSWSTKYAVVTWVGNHTRNVELRSTMERLTEPLARGWMEAAHQGQPPKNWVQPASVKTGPAFIYRTGILGAVVPSPANDLYPGWYAGGVNAKNSSQTIDRVSGKIATSCTPAAAKQTVSNANVAFWNVDIFKGGKASVQDNSQTAATTPQATDDIHNCSDSPPSVNLTAPQNCDTSCTITATVTQGTFPLTSADRPDFPGTITFTLGGQTIHTERVIDSPSTVTFTYNPTSSGSGTLTATVTDSVLYSGTSSTNINFTSPQVDQGRPNLRVKLDSHTGTNATISWDQVAGASKYTINLTGSGGRCDPSGAATASCTGLIPGQKYTATVTSDGPGATGSVDWTQ